MIRIMSSGCGAQSFAMQEAMRLGLIKFDAVIHVNVGDDSENPATIAYKKEVIIPHAKKYGIDFIELQATRHGEPTTLYQHLTRPGSRSIGIPVRMNGSGAPGRRSCTADFKIKVIDRWLREHGAKTAGAEVGLGISLDEVERVKPNTDPDTIAWKANVFPLLDEVEKPMSRQDCINLITRAGYPVPPKSACFFCPFHTLARWQEMRQHEPESFWKAAGLEKFLNERRASLGMDPVWFTRLLKPLDQATHEYGQQGLFDSFDGCEEGYCGL